VRLAKSAIGGFWSNRRGLRPSPASCTISVWRSTWRARQDASLCCAHRCMATGWASIARSPTPIRSAQKLG